MSYTREIKRTHVIIFHSPYLDMLQSTFVSYRSMPRIQIVSRFLSSQLPLKCMHIPKFIGNRGGLTVYMTS